MVNVISNLTAAIEKLKEAEDLLLLARRAFHGSSKEYKRIDDCFEEAGDIRTTVIDILSGLENETYRTLKQVKDQS